MRFKLSIVILCSALALSCSGKGRSSGGLDILSSDETEKAAQLVADANTDLRKIKKMFGESSDDLTGLEQAIKNKDVANVKSMSDGFVKQIDEGRRIGEEAIEKLDTAERMNINPTFREYLDLKTASLRKYIDAFEERRLAAELLRDGFDPSSQKSSDVLDRFKKQEEKFQKIMEDARQLSEEANVLAKESMKK